MSFQFQPTLKQAKHMRQPFVHGMHFGAAPWLERKIKGPVCEDMSHAIRPPSFECTLRIPDRALFENLTVPPKILTLNPKPSKLHRTCFSYRQVQIIQTETAERELIMSTAHMGQEYQGHRKMKGSPRCLTCSIICPVQQRPRRVQGTFNPIQAGTQEKAPHLGQLPVRSPRGERLINEDGPLRLQGGEHPAQARGRQLACWMAAHSEYERPMRV